MKTIASVDDRNKKVTLFFAIDESKLDKPFILGGHTNDPNLPPIAQTGGSISFGLENLDAVYGPGRVEWKEFLSNLGCEWVVPIIEKAQRKGNLKYALEEIKSKI
ncbi:hypothetical protein A1OW_22255 [Enterovibrio norvegicus]|uniref:hypothetical protein n=1 Tax=Enterovibrio norvegicus TaxID=188144 RepID=UPI00035E1778|nr:hypothetical protein [Enterovibrio norvegicus]OEF54431.1 hypothetical protein A1OW_22255 [Enterovibrio norvegicus]